MDLNRKAAYTVLLSMEKRKSYSNIELNRIINEEKPPSPAFVREIVYGVTENRIYIDYFLDSLVSRGLKSVKSSLLVLLRMGVYQIVFMDSVPDYAAVNETVSLARKVAKGRDGFVNGVLRSFLKKRDSLSLPEREEDECRYLSVKYSCNPAIVKMWLEQLGSEETEAVLSFSNTSPKTTLRANRLKCDIDELIDLLEQEGFRPEKSEISTGSCSIEGSGIVDSRFYSDGLCSIQNEESSYAAEVLAPEEGCTVIDMCAAPGGKTLAMAEIMGNRGRVIAADIYNHKLNLIDKQAERLGIDIVTTVLQDGTEYNDELAESADMILADVPCSGLGVIRRKPEIKYKENKDNFRHLAEKQLKILENAGKYLKEGGRLVYSTCTINEIENQNVVSDFLSGNGNFRLVFQRQLLPGSDGCDGFYVALIEKISRTGGKA